MAQLLGLAVAVRSGCNNVTLQLKTAEWSFCRTQPELRQAVLPKLKSNVDAGQGDAGTYAMVYDRTQRDGGKKQLYGEQLECSPGRSLIEAPIDDEATVNMRRAQLGLLRMELYGRLVRLHSPDMCGSGSR